jgi:GNAT superfamily N-acetyltransferase
MLTTRAIEEADPPAISAAFGAIGWDKPAEQYQRYLSEAALGARWVRIACFDGTFTGYVTVTEKSKYLPFQAAHIPEIQDLNVLPQYRKRGIAGRLLEECESWIAKRSEIAGIGVGLHPGYAAAQRLYVKRGYVPDGKGVTFRGRYVEEGESIVFDDELVLWLTKQLIREPMGHNNF